MDEFLPIEAGGREFGLGVRGPARHGRNQSPAPLFQIEEFLVVVADGAPLGKAALDGEVFE